MLLIKAQGLGDPYAELVSNFFAREFPGANANNPNTILEAVTTAFIASNHVRYGPVPNPESLVAIRDVIRKSIAAGAPIPILTPFGSRKSRLSESLDVAEVASLKQLACLQRRVMEFYAPGVAINLRLEDTSGHYLFADEGEASRIATTEYVGAFQKLVRILGMSAFVNPMLESTLFDETAYAATSDSIVPALMSYIADTDAYGIDGYQSLDSWKTLAAFGWQGNIPQEQRDYYRNRYRTLYPGITDYAATMKLARYFAGSWARIKHQGTGAAKEWGNDYLRVTFVAPVPGAPQGLVTRNIYYRTLPMKFATTHIPAWRAKGYLKINGEVIPKLASWGDPREYQSCSLVFGKGGETAEVKADYVICN
jgi:hypothetical protein